MNPPTKYGSAKSEPPTISIPSPLYNRIAAAKLHPARADALALTTWLVASRSRPDNYVPISHKAFGQYVRPNNVRCTLDTLREWDVISCDGVYSARSPRKKRKSFGYCLTSNAATSGVTSYTLRFKGMCKKLAPRTSIHDGLPLYGPVHQSLWNSLIRVGFDEQAAAETIVSLPAELHPYLRASFESVQKKQFRLTVCNYGRVHTNVTNMKRELRDHLQIGAPLGEIDIACSQPTLFAGSFPQAARSNQDFRTFRDLCVGGQLYFDLMDRLGYTDFSDESKDAFKDEHFFKFWYGPIRTSPCALEIIVKKEFPTVYAEMERRKRPNYRTFCRQLQKMESGLVIDTVCLRLFQSHLTIQLMTVHDSIMTTGEFLKIAEDELRQRFHELTDIYPRLKVRRPT